MSALLTRPMFDSPAALSAEFDRMLRDVIGGPRAHDADRPFAPPLDVEETDDAYTLHVELPGMSADQVELTLEDGALTIAGERPFYGDRDAATFRRVERRFGAFRRVVRLPDRVSFDKVDATFADGLLTVTVPKAPEAKPRRIEVSAS